MRLRPVLPILSRLAPAALVAVLTTNGLAQPTPAGGTAGARAAAPPSLPTAVAEIERIDALRSGLAGSFATTGAPADQQAFGQVCKPVGQAMQQAAQANGWQARQLAVKFRNPANRADAEAARVMGMMARDTTLQAMTLRTTFDGQRGTRYLRRITVEPSCLLCHGPRDTRPEFIRTQYPEDRAHGFSAGDLRGVYSVFMPAPR
jgi:hypothetical protein